MTAILAPRPPVSTEPGLLPGVVLGTLEEEKTVDCGDGPLVACRDAKLGAAGHLAHPVGDDGRPPKSGH